VILRRFAVPLLIVAAAGLYSVGIASPFTRHAESNLTLFGKHGRNFAKFGGVVPREISGPRLEAYDDPRKYYYVEHPFLPAWLVGASYAVFGAAEWSTRLPFLLFALGAIAVFWRVARRVIGEDAAPWASVAFALSPMIAYFSVATGHQAPTIFFLLLGILFYLRWIETGRRRELAGLFAAQVAACWSDWPGYYLALFLVAHALLVRRKSWKVAAASVGLNFAMFGGFVLLLYSLEPGGASCVRRLFFAGGSRAAGMGLVHYAVGEGREIALYFTLPLLVAAGAWIVTRFRRRDDADRTILCFLVFGVDEIVFRQLAARHDFYSYYLILFLALAGARTLREFAVSRAGRAVAVGALALFLSQSAWVLRNRLTQRGAYEFYRELGLALSEETPPEARVLILVDDIPHYTPWYGDRFALRYHAETRTLRYENMGTHYDAPDLVEFLDRRRSEFDAVVTARSDLAGGNEFFRRSGVLEKFHVLPPGSELERRLDAIAASVRVRRGFTFHFLGQK
jgi:hypothetical protein